MLDLGDAATAEDQAAVRTELEHLRSSAGSDPASGIARAALSQTNVS